MAPLYPILNKRIPRRYLYIGGMISMIVAYVLLVLFYIPGTLIQMTAILSLTDSIEYGAHILEMLRDPRVVKPANPENETLNTEDEQE
jgi:Na+/melibiose symporter-like transporter